MENAKPFGEENRRILITGANGFVGRHLVASLLSAEGEEGGPRLARIFAAAPPEEVASLTDSPAAPLGAAGWMGGDAGGWVTVVGLDVRDAEGTRRLLQETQPQEVYHLAARASGADDDREGIFAVNVEGTRNLLDAAAELKPFPRVLLISTSYVYGNTDPEHPAREEDPVGPLWRHGPYTDSKIAMEAVARSYTALALVARPFTHTGPGQLPIYALPTFARQLARIERGLEAPELQVGNLNALREVLDVRDVARAYRLIMARGATGATYNVATGSPHSLREILDQMRALCAVPTEVRVDAARLRPTDIACSTGSAFKLWSLCRWYPRYTLEETLRSLLDYWREQVG